MERASSTFLCRFERIFSSWYSVLPGLLEVPCVPSFGPGLVENQSLTDLRDRADSIPLGFGPACKAVDVAPKGVLHEIFANAPQVSRKRSLMSWP